MRPTRHRSWQASPTATFVALAFDSAALDDADGEVHGQSSRFDEVLERFKAAGA